jgi:hypothetical protein
MALFAHLLQGFSVGLDGSAGRVNGGVDTAGVTSPPISRGLRVFGPIFPSRSAESLNMEA